jgi:hypothetical protein
MKGSVPNTMCKREFSLSMLPWPFASRNRPQEASRLSIPGLSHPDESDVSLLFFFQVVVYFITETGLFFMLPDVKALCTRRMEALLCYVHQTEGKMGHPCFRPHGMICNNPWGSCRAMGGS